MEALQSYKIGFTGLSNGKHMFSFDIGSAFFDCFEQSEIAQGKVLLDLNMEKEDNMLVFEFVFKGWVELFCDRCLENYREPVDQQHMIYVKFGEEYSEPGEEVVVIPHGDRYFDVSHYVYEFLHLGLPLRRIHSDKEDGTSGCDQDMLKRAEALSPGNKQTDHNELPDGSPFEALKKLRFNKKNQKHL